MNNLLKIILFSGIRVSMAFAQEPFDPVNPSDFDRKVIGFAGHPASRVTWINEQNQDLVIQRLKLMRSMHDYSGREESIDTSLVSLGDEEATARVVENFLQNRGGLATSHLTEIALPYMVNAFYTADPTPRGGGDGGGPSIKETIMFQFFSTIRKSRLFTDETRQWAWETFRLSGLPEDEVEKQAKLAQQWWEHNEKAVLEKRYRDATWLPAMAGVQRDEGRTDYPPSFRVSVRFSAISSCILFSNNASFCPYKKIRDEVGTRDIGTSRDKGRTDDSTEEPSPTTPAACAPRS